MSAQAENFGLLVYIVYLAVFAFLLFFVVPKKYKNCSFSRYWVSNFGEKKAASYLIFKISFLIFAFLNLFFLKIFSDTLPDIFLSKIAVLFFIAGIVLFFLLPFFPQDTKPKAHQKIANCLFIAIIIFISLSLKLVFVSERLPSVLGLLGVVILVFAFNRLISIKRAVKILRIKPAADSHNRRFNIYKMRQSVTRLPECIIIRMNH